MAVSIDDRDKIRLMLERVEREYGAPRPDFTFLSDPGHRVIDRYGLLNEADRRGIPHPTVLVIDREGVVRWKSIEVNYKVRPTNAMILEALGRVLNRSREAR